ncbi:hypothetical protein PN499_24115 [Kamptonema animale CS-326]|jgi:ABC-type cobalamin transport system ATPase subunit|uniref:hypothetical protein n=1 Tax=Kamptonema TaxID=1501433 RepID=UPI0001DAC65E|nr:MULTISPECIES: hypothetical protein [Kamptonema]MDB9514290.1 hypothetical protein [Kamptonema animale CS-326]CBN54328.1 conserved hypothetical protein [Kamptonema sp. PCC 6506]
MELLTVWQHGSHNPENTNNLDIIRHWWANLNGKEVNWVERLIPQIGGMSEVNWQSQRFDQIFVIVNPEIRGGDTLYWYKPDSPLEHSQIAQKLELDNLKQHLYIYPQSESELAIRVELHQFEYQTIELQNVEITFKEKEVMTLRDVKQQLEVKVTLTPINLNLLKEWLL